MGGGELGFWEALCATARRFYHGSSSSRSCGSSPQTSSSSTRLHQRHCQQHHRCVGRDEPVCIDATSFANVRYVRRIPNSVFTMDLLAYVLLLLFMLISTSSLFVFHMLVVVVVMLNILELIMELLPNFPTFGLPRACVVGINGSYKCF